MYVETFEKKVKLDNTEERLNLFGPNEQWLDIIQNQSNVQIITRHENILLQGEKEDVDRLANLFNTLIKLIKKGFRLSERDIYYALELAKDNLTEELLDLYGEKIITTYKGKEVYVKSLGQKHYISTIRKKDIVFGIGPAGTGKTYLAVVMAVSALKKGQVRKIVLTRPAVEAGENLGFLPGDLQEKVDPYLRPIYDALYDLLGVEQVNKFLERGLIEIAPLAYMRGRTLNDSFVILDEAQNTTPEQMKMFLTRLGFGSKMVITGDVTQIDLPKGKKSGLNEAERILKRIEEIGFIYLSEQDVVRHYLVQKIISAYDRES
ncbi:phosphate starvation-inducible protein PhoH [Vulcanibacillus modesticaldus]|uniref:PhoH-like protein n=1 Tax=Vulcanibacillus modesticaldus TaxID=337097 RepID=A0A1D2YVH7_9BACI|nr:PhoH family protein [Vulcanibacillus modesticaldus]OEF99724.1 phosphate starvation-inducible protein PhoH [Vulcanibacillus modesticaldus]